MNQHKAYQALKQNLQPIIAKLIATIESLATEPRPNGVRKLTGTQDLYRVRVADYRIVYRIEDDRLVIEVVRVAHRKEVYR